MKILEHQIGQVASSSQTRNQGKLPSTTEVNPREHCKAITLRSGANYEGPSMTQADDTEAKAEEFVVVDAKEEMKKEVRVPKWRKAREERMMKEEVKLDDQGVPLTPVPPPFPR
ncbi:hypothetical protein ACS0TY_018549 [Phlomoides rotata]